MLVVVCCTDTMYYVIINIFGAYDFFTRRPLGLLQNVTDIVIISDVGNSETRLPATELRPLRQYAVETMLPTSGICAEFVLANAL